MSRWGDEKTIKFIRLYRDYECLWNSSNSSLYKNKIARDNAYIKIQEEMNEYKMTVKYIKNKIKGLRSTYHQELHKIKNSKSSGAGSDVYKPSLKWFEEMNFLNDIFEYRNSTSTEMQESTFQINIKTFEQLQPSSETITELEEPQASSRTSIEVLEKQRSPLNSNKHSQAVAKKKCS